MVGNQIHQQCLCSLCNTMPLQHVATTDANKPEKNDLHNIMYILHVWLGNIFQYYCHLAILEPVISILQAFSYFNNVTYAIYHTILPCNTHHYTTV